MPVTIFRDAYGIPHLYADTTAALFFGFGYIQAKDRLEALIRNLKQARGELAELDGITALEGDVAVRAFCLSERAQTTWRTLPGVVRAEIGAFAAGINRWQKEAQERRPEGAFMVTPQDILTFALFVNLAFSQEGLAAGSNAFVVAPTKLKSGNGSLISMDPHLPLQGFYRWYEARLVGGEFDQHGVTFVGLPYLGMACNAHLAWANTVNQPDLSDLYVLRLRGKNKDGYEYDTQTRALEFREFVFKVKGGGEVSRKIAYSHHGPLLAEGIAVRKAGGSEAGNVLQSRAQGVATTVSEYRQALALRGTVMFNHLFGDTSGQVGYVWGGRIPRRPDGFDFSGPVPGWTSATEWGEPVEFAELPQCESAPQGFFQSCNDGPTRTGAGANLTPPGPFPAWLASDSQTLRGQRLHALLEQAGSLDLALAKTIATDCRDLSADTHLPRLLAEARGSQALPIWQSWDRTLTRDARGAALFQLALREGSLAQAITRLARLGLPLDVPWGELHRHRRGGVDLPMDGGGESLCPHGGEPGPDGRITVTFGSSFRMLAQLSDTAHPELWAAQPYGNSDDPESPHYTDQMELACRRAYRKVPWTRVALEAECTEHLKLD